MSAPKPASPVADWSRLPGAVVPFNWKAFWQKHRAMMRDVGFFRAAGSMAGRVGLYGLGQMGWLLDAALYPNWRQTPMAPPIFILGHQRSGTTILHRLLSTDTHARSLQLHEMVLPAVSIQKAIAGIGRWDSRHGGRIGARFHRLQDQIFAGMDEMHRLRLDEIEEDEFVLWAIFASTMAINDAPNTTGNKDLDELRDFHRWSTDRQIDALGWYRACLLKKVYRTPATDDIAPWIVSKNPHFSQKIPELRHVFPDARFVYLLRDPLETIASRLDLIRAIWRHRFKDFRDMTPDQARTIVADSVRTYLNAERDLPTIPESQKLVISFDELRTAVPETVRRIYRHFSLPGPDAALSEALAKIAREKRVHIAAKRSPLAEFGIDPAALRAELEPVYANHPGRLG